jgi:uncharacterized membrane protein (UPF0127 family)
MLPNLAVVVVAALLGATPTATPYCTPALFLAPAPAPFGTAPRPLRCRVYPLAAPKASLSLAVATSEPDRERGLMFVRDLPTRAGMIFAFPDGDLSRVFWMKNTLIPLDMVFVESDGRVTGVARNVPATTPSTPDDLVPRRSGLAAYVIELNAGEARRAGILTRGRLDLRALDSN